MSDSYIFHLRDVVVNFDDVGVIEGEADFELVDRWLHHLLDRKLVARVIGPKTQFATLTRLKGWRSGSDTTGTPTARVLPCREVSGSRWAAAAALESSQFLK